MLKVQKYVSMFFVFIASMISYIPAAIYEYIFSEFFTKYASYHIELHIASLEKETIIKLMSNTFLILGQQPVILF
jgi:hypothetical protein